MSTSLRQFPRQECSLLQSPKAPKVDYQELNGQSCDKDMMVEHMRWRPQASETALILHQVWPGLGRVSTISSWRTFLVPDGWERRHRAGTGLRELVKRHRESGGQLGGFGPVRDSVGQVMGVVKYILLWRVYWFWSAVHQALTEESGKLEILPRSWLLIGHYYHLGSWLALSVISTVGLVLMLRDD